MEEYVKLGFYGADFSENTLRWQLSTIMWRTIRGYAFKNVGKPEKTGWGEYADIWLKEDSGDMTARTFNYCTVESKGGDTYGSSTIYLRSKAIIMISTAIRERLIYCVILPTVPLII